MSVDEEHFQIDKLPGKLHTRPPEARELILVHRLNLFPVG
jgi:hypothetical protein